MNTYFAYVRVSTHRQGATGVSLQEQRSAIADYAAREGLVISAWFEEQQSAAKAGRPIFQQMLGFLNDGHARGVILLKVDRGTRNLREWADIGDLIDSNVDVRLAGEAVDLQTRGGRLSADIQAVIASDYIRSLREETRRGFYGRIKQGLYPLPAPVGYVDNGRGKEKTIHPVYGSTIRHLFEFYAEGSRTLKETCAKASELGLLNRRGKQLTVNGISRLLRNPFYTGRIRIEGGKTIVPGRHEPLISEGLFQIVQALLSKRQRRIKVRHHYLFAQFMTCHACAKSLYGELQKGHTYYRCHGSCLNRTSWREEMIVDSVEQKLTEIFGREHMIFAAFTRGEAFQKRILLTHLSFKILVRENALVLDLPGGDFELPTWQSHLSRILNEILLKPVVSSAFTPMPVRI